MSVIDLNMVTAITMEARVVNLEEKLVEINKAESGVGMRVLKGLAYVAFSTVAIYWISKVLQNYLAYPVYTTVSLENNETFTWPSLTICNPYYTTTVATWDFHITVPE